MSAVEEKVAWGCLARIRCHSALSQPLLSSTHHERELLGTSLDPRVTQRGGGLGEQEFLSKYNKDRLRLTFLGDLCSAISQNCFRRVKKDSYLQ